MSFCIELIVANLMERGDRKMELVLVKLSKTSALYLNGKEVRSVTRVSPAYIGDTLADINIGLGVPVERILVESASDNVGLDIMARYVGDGKFSIKVPKLKVSKVERFGLV